MTEQLEDNVDTVDSDELLARIARIEAQIAALVKVFVNIGFRSTLTKHDALCPVPFKDDAFNA